MNGYHGRGVASGYGAWMAAVLAVFILLASLAVIYSYRLHSARSIGAGVYVAWVELDRALERKADLVPLMLRYSRHNGIGHLRAGAITEEYEAFRLADGHVRRLEAAVALEAQYDVLMAGLPDVAPAGSDLALIRLIEDLASADKYIADAAGRYEAALDVLDDKVAGVGCEFLLSVSGARRYGRFELYSKYTEAASRVQ